MVILMITNATNFERFYKNAFYSHRYKKEVVILRNRHPCDAHMDHLPLAKKKAAEQHIWMQ